MPGTLFPDAFDEDEQDVHRVARRLARRDDPGTSKQAAREVAVALGERQRETLEALRRHPGMTATELARAEGHGDPRVYNRRLPELRDAGRAEITGVRRCRVTGKSASVWRASG